ncbi:MAG: aldehyde reductase [Solirubrobacterales bacterium]|nr:aldehyde reductase [Solirubrobacterales bacterium]
MSEPIANAETTVLVTGGSGFLGGRAINQLLDQGYRVRTTVRDESKSPAVREAVTAGVNDPDLTFFEADLGNDDGWKEAIEGCDYVLHIASPFPTAQPKDPQELIGPARDGALRVLRASLDANVKRVVMTSSVAAIKSDDGPPSTEPLTEDDWTNPDTPGLSPYAQSKTIAERAAWDLVKETGDEDRLAVVNPSAILGPLLGNEDSTSLQIIQRMLDGMPAAPRLGFSYVDVRDTADLHIRAMNSPAAGGKRFIASGPFLWMTEVADILRDELPDEGAKAPKRTLPKPLVRVLSLFDPAIRALLPDIGKESHFSAAQAKDLLDWEPRAINETIADCGRSLAHDR